MNKRLSTILAALLLSGLSCSVLADWQLNPEASNLYYVTSKASAVTELNSFTRLAGNIKNDGKASLIIDLSSVETNVDIRNERMRNIVFEVNEYSSAIISVDIDPSVLSDMPIGARTNMTVDAMLSMRAMGYDLSADLQVIKLGENSIVVQTNKPLILNIASLELSAEVEALRELASLPAINPNVVISFSLLYEQE